MINLAIFASGSGSNAMAIIKYFGQNAKAKICCVVTDNPEAGVISKAQEKGVKVFYADNSIRNSGALLNYLKSNNIDFIVLAGYLKKMGKSIVETYSNSILNIHPSLLPDYGGKGMYGLHVHMAVIQHQEQYSGITIHLVNQQFDDGRILFQKSLAVSNEDTPESLAVKINTIELKYYPAVVEAYLQQNKLI